MINTPLANTKQRYKSSFSVNSNPSSQHYTNRNSSSQKSLKLFILDFWSKHQRSTNLLVCSLLNQHIGSILWPWIPTGSSFRVLFSPSSINGDFRFEHFQRLLSYKSLSIHHFQPQGASVLASCNQKTTIQLSSSNLVGISNLSFLEMMLCTV